ncbi:hypothetical protein P691DRAFT_810634 [Macrolepiota fuliginosa MF-IS2]|uniref:DUF7729 domain-containing protein n=1 Tax=Macrolepiota fuliginosa MF-IS2 TaxID=1400762 RepID=A0A9P5XG31_9AGAR|nr:hypothetical protein P691DRAFT_810634 [Macrolepiota fuliginosa MF-IS2]
MGWFASTLKTACADDLKDKNAMAVDTLTALNAYELMYNTACLSDPTTNTYCYIDAAASPNPADLYLYQLPFGTSVPPNTTGFTCSSCSKSILGSYAAALDNNTIAADLTGLKTAYGPSVQIVDAVCGNQFAKSGAVNSATSVHFSYGFSGILVAVLALWSLIF